MAINSNISFGKVAASGFIWSAARRFGDLGLKFLVGIILARLLTPADFGIVAMVTAFVALGTGIADAGFTAAIIQRQQLSQRDLSSVFYFNICMAAVVSALIYLGAPLVAGFYKQPELTIVLRILCLTVLFGALGSIHQSQLVKLLAFRRIMLASLPALLLSGGVAVVMAYHGWGVWALVAQALTQAFLTSAFLWLVSSWRPTLEFSMTSIGSLFPFGSRLALSGLIYIVYQNLYILVIGRLFTPTDLAYYQRAHEFNRMGAQNLSGIAESVMFPVYCKIQDDRKRLKRIFERSLFLLTLVTFPLMGMMAGLADPLIALLLGEQWLPSAIYLKWLCVAGALYPIHAANLGMLKALGESRLFLRLEIVKKITAIIVLACTVRYGILAIVAGQVVTSILALGINGCFNRKLIGVRYQDVFTQCLGPASVALIVFLLCAAVAALLPGSYVLALAVGGLVAFMALAIYVIMIKKKLEAEISLLTSKFPIIKRLGLFKSRILL